MCQWLAPSSSESETHIGRCSRIMPTFPGNRLGFRGYHFGHVGFRHAEVRILPPQPDSSVSNRDVKAAPNLMPREKEARLESGAVAASGWNSEVA